MVWLIFKQKSEQSQISFNQVLTENIIILILNVRKIDKKDGERSPITILYKDINNLVSKNVQNKFQQIQWWHLVQLLADQLWNYWDHYN